MTQVELRAKVLLTSQASLVGMITPIMHCVVVSWTEKTVNLRVVFSETPTDQDTEIVSEVETLMLSHLYPEFQVSIFIETLEHGSKVSDSETVIFETATPP